MLAGEKQLLGLYISGHPLTRYASLLEKYQLASIEALSDLGDKTLTRVGGIITQMTKRITKTSKENMAILQLESLDGSAEVLVFPEAYQKYGLHLNQDSAVLVCGEVSTRDAQAKIIAYEVYPLDDAPRHFAQRVSLHLPATQTNDERLARITAILRSYPGNTPVVVCLQFPSGEKVFMDTDESFGVFPDEQLLHELEHELGEEGVYVAINPTPCKNAKKKRDYRRRNGLKTA